MFLGEIVEVAVAETLFENPLHPYSQALISAVPIPDRTEIRERILLKEEEIGCFKGNGCCFYVFLLLFYC